MVLTFVMFRQTTIHLLCSRLGTVELLRQVCCYHLLHHRWLYPPELVEFGLVSVQFGKRTSTADDASATYHQ